MSTHFKLKFDQLTRRVSFADKPSWQELSQKIFTLYSIPQHQVGVTYIDAENEEITLNTEEELQDYYFSSYQPGETVKFSVRDLSSRNQRQSAPENTGIRNTFGQFVDPEITGFDEWQTVNNIPSLEEILGHASSTSDVRSAFVESIISESEGTTIGKGSEENTSLAEPAAEGARSGVTEPRISSEEKGKERAHSIRSMSSTQSLLAADIGDKHPVHVYDVNSGNTRTPLVQAFAFDDAGDPIPAESTPRASTSLLDASSSDKKADQTPELQVEDPPIPPLETTDPRSASQAADSTQSAQASASLARDVASFLSAISNIISSHPELGESLRTIVRNTTNGTYWASHREALSQAAAELQRNSETIAEDGRRMVEEEAGKRVAEALSGVLRTFSQAQDGVRRETPPSNPSTNFNAPQADAADASPYQDANPQTTGPPQPESPHPPTPPIPGAFSSTDFRSDFGGVPFSRRHTWRSGWRARASMPPYCGIGGGFPGWAMLAAHPPFGPGVLNATGPPASSTAFFNNNVASASGPGSTPGPDHTNLETSNTTDGHERPSAQQLRAKVEEAKRAYRAEKERYRREKEERKVDKDKDKDKEKTPKMEELANTSHNPDVTISFSEDSHIAANTRHGFPRFDIVNVTEATPQRHNTHLGHFPRRHERPVEDLFTRAVNRISKRLADMGFTEKVYPDLRQKIKNHLPADGAITKESEDDIVTTLLEAMLAAPKSPVASGSGGRDIPGGWH